jgi:hypothetical protein
VFGIIKSVLGFRQFLLRGLDNVRGEWNLVTLAACRTGPTTRFVNSCRRAERKTNITR